MQRIRLILAIFLALIVLVAPSKAVRANGGPGGGGLTCEPQQGEKWTGTQLTPKVLQLNGNVKYVDCPFAQVNGAAGNTKYTTTGGSPQPDGTPCKGQIWSDVSMAGLLTGTWQASYFDPNVNQVVGTRIRDDADIQLTTRAWTLQGMAGGMGAFRMVIPWAMQGTYQAGVCVPDSQGWTDFEGTRQCDPTGPGYPTQCVVFGAPRGTLTYTPPAASTFTPYLQDVVANMKATYHTGTASTTWANGGYAVGQSVVRYPVCYAESGGNLGTPHYFEILIPQPNPGPALVVDYVVSANVDQTWWDFGDGNSQVVPIVAPGGACSVEHTYYHVSADVYGSHLNHTSPPGQTWSFGDEPQKDMAAIEAWHHVAVTVQAFYRQPDGTTVEQDIPVPPGTDFWLADTPEWQTVYQIESIPCRCTPAASGG